MWIIMNYNRRRLTTHYFWEAAGFQLELVPDRLRFIQKMDFKWSFAAYIT